MNITIGKPEDAVRYFGITDRGKIRKDNQDCFLVEKNERTGAVIVVLCDGMGGAKAGGLASEVASKTFMSYVSERLSDPAVKKPMYKNILSGGCAAANGVVYQYSCFDADYSGMGTTLVGGILVNGKAYIVNVGDSRAYRITKKTITQITTDHSLVEEMVQRGEITRQAARNHPRKNIITNALGLEDEIVSDVFEAKFSKGDYFLFCSDGLSNLIDEDEIIKISRSYKSAEDIGKALMEISLERNSPDNVTAVVVIG